MLRLLLFLSISALTAPVFAQNAVPEPMFSRLAQKPAWETTLTPRLERLPTPVSSPEAARMARGESYAASMSRAARLRRLGTLNQVVWWRGEIALPPNAENWPVALDADETRVIQGVFLNGAALPKWSRRDKGDVWSSGEGSALLPLSAGKRSGILTLKTVEHPKIHANGFGQLRLRPATLSEVLRIEKREGEREVGLKNESALPLRFALHVRHEDYYGAPLGGKDANFELAPGATQNAALEMPDNPQLYKTRVWATSGERVSLDHWITRAPRISGGGAAIVASLSGGWEWVFVPGPHESNPPPASGWKRDGSISAAENYTTHWAWLRRKMTVPADWDAARKIQLALPASGNHVSTMQRVLVDGKFVAQVAQWELPKRLDLPELAPGSEHEITIGVTDYVAGLVPGTPVPPGGAASVTGRKTMAPIPNVGIPMGIGFNDRLELWGVSPIRTDFAQIITTTKGIAPQIRVNLELRSDLASAAATTINAAVYARGQKVFTLPTRQLTLESGQTTKTEIAAIWPSPRLWTPEDPFLHELRVELKDAAERVLDTRRERFGFREWGIEGNAFTLNNQRIHILGGSHIDLKSYTWPVQAHPYRVLRYSGGSTDLSDEMGHLLKPESGNTNAHGQDNYAWERPEMWARLESRIQGDVRNNVNRPSVFMWDVGNEISFTRPGEADKMGELLQKVRSFDPARFASVGGGEPNATGALVFDAHGWGDANTRTDYFYFHPEDRPSYLKNQGTFNYRPANETPEKWTADLTKYIRAANVRPGNTDRLSHNGGRPIFFSEGHYYNDANIPTYLFGHDAFKSLPLDKGAPGGWIWGAQHGINMLASRGLSLQNVRQAGFSGTMLHVDRGVGRYALPLSSFSWDRKTRFNSGARMQTQFGVHNDLTNANRITARYRLFDGKRLLGEKTAELSLKLGTIGLVDLDFALPAVATDRTLRLEIRAWPNGGISQPVWFYDDIPITVYAPAPLQLPARQRLALYDPNGAIAPHLTSQKVPFTRLARLGDWNSQGSVLMVGSGGLNRAADAELSQLRVQIVAGGRTVVLDHRELPAFLAQPLSQVKLDSNNAARLDAPSPVTAGMLNEDFRAWTTRERDQVVSWNPIETPSAGRFRVHLTTVKTAPVLEVEEGLGRVLFAQLNFADALGVEPAATKVLNGLLRWTGTKSPFETSKTLLVSADSKFIGGMQGRIGLTAPTVATPTAAQLGADVIVMSGAETGAIAALQSQKSVLAARLKEGATLFIYDLNPDGAAFLSDLVGSRVQLEEFPHVMANLTSPNPLTAGLGHADFYTLGLANGYDSQTPMKRDDKRTGNFVVRGEKVQALTSPAYLSEIAVGRGRVVINLVRSLEYPLPSQMRVLSTVLANTGAHLDPTGAASGASQSWNYATLDLGRFANASFQSAGLPAGIKVPGAVPFAISKAPQSLVGVARNGAPLPQNKNIPINRRADRLVFLHGASGGVPSAIYRVFFKAERARWIPGMPDPFVDVAVRPGDNLLETRDAGRVAKGERFLPAASAVLVGQGGAGLFQFAWDNPKPDQEIESVELIAPVAAGRGKLFLAALTLANRDQGAAVAVLTPPLSVVAPGVKPEQVEAQVQFARYGFVLLKDGTIASIYDAAGVPFARADGWNATLSAPTQTALRQTGTRAKIESTTRGGQRIFTVSGADNSPLKWRIVLVATPGGLRYELNYRHNSPGARAGLQMTVQTQGTTTTEGTGVNIYPAMLPGPSGLSTLAFDRRYYRIHHGYFVTPTSIRFVSPPSDAPPVVAGREESLWWELAAP